MNAPSQAEKSAKRAKLGLAFFKCIERGVCPYCRKKLEPMRALGGWAPPAEAFDDVPGAQAMGCNACESIFFGLERGDVAMPGGTEITALMDAMPGTFAPRDRAERNRRKRERRERGGR